MIHQEPLSSASCEAETPTCFVSAEQPIVFTSPCSQQMWMLVLRNFYAIQLFDSEGDTWAFRFFKQNKQTNKPSNLGSTALPLMDKNLARKLL